MRILSTWGRAVQLDYSLIISCESVSGIVHDIVRYANKATHKLDKTCRAVTVVHPKLNDV